MGYLWVIYGKTYNKQRNKIGANVIQRGLMRIKLIEYRNRMERGFTQIKRMYTD